MNARTRRGQLEVILASLAFALSVPAGKLLLADVAPLALSGVLYLSAGLLCLVLILPGLSSASGESTGRNAIQGSEWAWLAGAVLCGGVLAPLALLTGMREISGHTAGLLLNFEAVFTVGIGAAVSGERLGKRGWLGAVAILAGAVLLSFGGGGAPSGGNTDWKGIILVVAACVLWGIDNNLTQRVSLRDARQVVAVKGLVAGTVSLTAAAMLGQLTHWSVPRVAAAAAVGAISFGLSITLFVRGLRELGVIQTGMLFSLAPGFAAVLSWIALKEPVTAAGFAALALMTTGALVLSTDQHDHRHTHEAMEHSHEHSHDEHHQHDHKPGELETVPHSHPHRHEPMTHAHPHVHDIHHRHRH